MTDGVFDRSTRCTRKKQNETRLIVAASEHDPDMLYATRMFVPDPFIFLSKTASAQSF